MTVTRPSQGGSVGTWGTELNAWLDVAHNADGTLKASALGGYIPAAPIGINAKAQYGVKGDFKLVTDGAMTSGSAVLTSATGTFTSADVGKTVYVASAGAAGATLLSTIASVQSATQVTLNATASSTVSSKTYGYGTDDTTAIQNAINAAAALYTSCWLPPSACLASGLLTLTYGCSGLFGAGALYGEGTSDVFNNPFSTWLVLAPFANTGMIQTDTAGPVKNTVNSVSRRWQRSTIAGINFDPHGNLQTGSNPTIYANAIWSLKIRDCSFIRSAGPAIKTNACNEIKILDCDASIDAGTATPPAVFHLLDTADSLIANTQGGGSSGPVLLMEGSVVGTPMCHKNRVVGSFFFNAKVGSGHESGVYCKNAQANYIEARVDQNYADGAYIDANSYGNHLVLTAQENGFGNATGCAAVLIDGNKNCVDGTATPFTSTSASQNQTVGVHNNGSQNAIGMVAYGHTDDYVGVTA